MPSMEPNDTQEKQPSDLLRSEDTSNGELEIKTPKNGRFLRRKYILGFVLLLFLTLTISAVGGYYVGNRQGNENRNQLTSQVADEQYQLALEDIEAGRYDIARQRLEYISRLDPTYPGVAEKLAEALLILNAPTATQVILSTPTPNLSPVIELFEQAQAAFNEGDWTLAIDTLLLLRVKDLSYQPIEVDGLIFAALRNRGVDRISKEGRLEEGIYDLSRAELFGPLDRDADNWRSWAELYLLANSYMGLDWAKATYYFSQLYAIAPYLKNDTYLKYAISAHAYGDQLYAEKDPCGAEAQYQQSLLAWEDAALFPTATKAAKACLTATAPAPPPPPPVEETPPTEETPLEPEFTETPSPTETPQP